MGRGRRATAASPVVVEQRFLEAAQALFDRVTDWNTATVSLEDDWNQLLILRNQVFEAYGRPQEVMFALPALPSLEIAWKAELNRALQARMGKAITKEDIRYECQEVAAADGARHGGYVASITAEGLELEHQSPEAAPSKKQAEALAAKAALESEFPTEFVRVNKAHQQKPHLAATPRAPGPFFPITTGPISTITTAAAGGNAQKRKFSQVEESTDQNQTVTAKTRLFQAITLLKGTSTSKGDITFDTQQVEGTQDEWVCTITLVAHDPDTTYEGPSAMSKKDAENCAAEVALKAIEHVLAPLEEEHKAKKEAKKKEQLAALKERAALKKLAKKGEVIEE